MAANFDISLLIVCNAGWEELLSSSSLNKAAEESDVVVGVAVAVEDDDEGIVHIDIGVGRTNESTVAVERAASAMMRRRR